VIRVYDAAARCDIDFPFTRNVETKHERWSINVRCRHFGARVGGNRERDRTDSTFSRAACTGTAISQALRLRLRNPSHCRYRTFWAATRGGRNQRSVRALFLIAHPKGTLIWDTGAVPDADWKPTGTTVTYHVVLPDSQERDVTMVKPLKVQLAEVGYSPSDITYLALSHYHYDHNANVFAGATWLVRQDERDAMFAEKAPGVTQPSTYAALRNSKTVIIKSDEYDVFGDGTVVIKSAPGHTPGHQVLYLKLAKTGGIVLSGDLYHYPEERILNRVPTFEFNQAQTRSSRVAIDAFLKKTSAQLWIQHDFKGNAGLKKAPDYYE
jgi:N-acyl homoserine lactone hydrolase